MIRFLKSNSRKIIILSSISFLIFIIVFLCLLLLENRNEAIFKNEDVKVAVEQFLNDKNITLKDVKDIEVLRLENVDLSEGFEDLALFNNLKELYIYRCNVESIDDLMIPESVNLLDVSFNRIEAIPLIENLNGKAIDTLILDNNPINKINTESSVLKKVKFLSLNSCKLKGKIKFGYLPELEVLSLEGNALEEIYGELPKIKKLSLKSNNLDSIYDISIRGNLVELNIAENCLKDLEGIEGLRALEKIDIRENLISEVSILKILKNLNTVYLDRYIDRKDLDFMKNTWKDGDVYTKQYMLKNRYNLELQVKGEQEILTTDNVAKVNDE